MRPGPPAALQRRWAGAQVSARIQQLPGAVVIPRDAALKKRHAESRIWNETWLAAFFHKPCNHELFVLQSLNMEGEPPPPAPAGRPDAGARQAACRHSPQRAPVAQLHRPGGSLCPCRGQQLAHAMRTGTSRPSMRALHTG